MNRNRAKWIHVALSALVALAMLSCSGEPNRDDAPVFLVASNTIFINQFDIDPESGGCTTSVGSIDLLVVPKNTNPLVGTNTDNRFDDVRIKRYRVSYQRTDGGTQVPTPFVRTLDQIIIANGAGSINTFTVLEREALTFAPFVSLYPVNGGRDPETGRRTIKMDVIVELFGETLAGENVNASTRFPLDFCFDCGGCV